MVHIFFVISGFVLSKKPLELVRAHKYDRLLTTSKVFSEFYVVRHAMGPKCCQNTIGPSNIIFKDESR